jgi:hypothetical protein
VNDTIKSDTNVTGAVADEPCESAPGWAASLKRPEEKSGAVELARWAARSLTVLALLASTALLLVDATSRLTAAVRYFASIAPAAWAVVTHAPLSALPLLFAGLSYLALQLVLRPRSIELVKRVMLASAFLLWGVVQLMPASTLATDLGDLVIVLYVLDLGIIVSGELAKA